MLLAPTDEKPEQCMDEALAVVQKMEDILLRENPEDTLMMRKLQDLREYARRFFDDTKSLKNGTSNRAAEQETREIEERNTQETEKPATQETRDLAS